MIAFVQQNNFEFWKNQINSWIETLSINDTFWNIDEKLENTENTSDYSLHYNLLHIEN